VNERLLRNVKGRSPQRAALIIRELPESRGLGVCLEVLPEYGIAQQARICVASQMLNLAGSLPANIFALIRWIMLNSVVPGVHVLRVTAHREGLKEQVAGVVACARKGLATVGELFFGHNDVGQDECL
jgi:hypothetical protein